MVIGAHLSIAKGLSAAIFQAKKIGANAFQFFTRNPRGGRARKITVEEMEKFLRQKEAEGIQTVVGHLPYTINLATNRPDIHRFAQETLLADLERADAFDVDFLVVHPGSHLGEGIAAGIERIVSALTYVLERYHGKTRLLLETMAGQGTEIGGSLAELEEIFDRLQWPEMMGICLDSCHLFGAGYDLRHEPGIDRLVQDIKATIGMERVYVVHLNDARVELASRRDRHERLGKGKLGEAGIAAIINHTAFCNLPFLLETPVDRYEDYGEQISLVRQLSYFPGQK